MLFLLSGAVTGWLHFNVGLGELGELVVVVVGGRPVSRLSERSVTHREPR